MNGDDASEAYWIEHRLTPEQRAKHFRDELEKLAEKWRIPEDKRRDLRTACDYDHVVAGDVFYAEVQRCALAQAALRHIVNDARDEDRADMRDSVDEQFIEEARLILDGKVPKRYQVTTIGDTKA